MQYLDVSKLKSVKNNIKFVPSTKIRKNSQNANSRTTSNGTIANSMYDLRFPQNNIRIDATASGKLIWALLLSLLFRCMLVMSSRGEAKYRTLTVVVQIDALFRICQPVAAFVCINSHSSTILNMIQ